MGLQKTFIQAKELTYPHYYLCNYLPVTAGKDNLSHSILKFKRGEEPHPDAWIDCSLDILAAGLPTTGIPLQFANDTPIDPAGLPSRAPADPSPVQMPIPLLSQTPTPPSGPIPPGAVIIRALHHNETMAEPAGPTSLDRLGRALASRFQCRYAPTLLCKSRLTRQIKGLTQQQRESELHALYYIDTASPDYAAFAGCPLYPGQAAVSQRPFLIIDDILTTGTTIKMIIAAVLLQFPGSPIIVFTLAKADYNGSSNQPTTLKGQNYQLGQGMDWIVSEEPTPYYSTDQLKAWIASGSF